MVLETGFIYNLAPFVVVCVLTTLLSAIFGLFHEIQFLVLEAAEVPDKTIGKLIILVN